MFVVCRLQEPAQAGEPIPYTRFIYPQKAHDHPIDRDLLWTVIAWFGVPPEVVSANRHVHDGMRARARIRTMANIPGSVRSGARAPSRVCAVATAVQFKYLLHGGDYGRYYS